MLAIALLKKAPERERDGAFLRFSLNQTPRMEETQDDLTARTSTGADHQRNS
jgi:hypothetical protein